MEKYPQNVEKKELSMGERIANAIRENRLDLHEIMGMNTSDEEINLIIKKIEAIDPKSNDGYELHSLFVKLIGYDENTEKSERKKIAAQMRITIDEIFMK